MIVELDQEEINLVLSILLDKRKDLDVVLKNQDGLEPETVKELLIEHRDIGNIVREMQFFARKASE